MFDFTYIYWTPMILNCSRCSQVLDRLDPNSLPDGSPEIGGELGDYDLGEEGGETLGEEAEEVKSTVGEEEEEDTGDEAASDPESLATTISLGPNWSPVLRGSARPADQDTQQVQSPEPSPSKEHMHIESSKKELNQPAPCRENI